MSDCRHTGDRLTAYVDGVLGSDERREVERHLTSCSDCRVLAAEEHAGRTILRSRAAGLLAEPLPPGLRSRCEALAAAGPGSSANLARPGPWWRVRLVPTLLTAVVFVFMASAIFSLATSRSETLLAAQLTADHSKCFRLFAPPPGTSVDALEMERMLATQYGRAVHLPPSSGAEDVQLVGLRRCVYGEGMLPHIMYRVQGQELSLFVLNGAVRRTAEVVTLGHRSQIWSRDGTTFVLVSPAAAEGVSRAVRYLMREAR